MESTSTARVQPCSLILTAVAALSYITWTSWSPSTLLGVPQALHIHQPIGDSNGTMTSPKPKILVFSHIPKTGGSTIEQVGLEAGLKWGKKNDFYNGTVFQATEEGKRKMPGHCSFWHVPPKLFPAPNPYKDPGSEVFCVVRDPWERLVSEFMYRWKEVRKSDHIARCDPDAFTIWLDISLQTIESGNRLMHDCHMLPQYEYIRDSAGHIWCQHTLDLKNITLEFNELMSRWKLDAHLDAFSKANEGKDPVCSAIREAPLTKLFPLHLRKRVRKVYAEDFAHLGDSLT